MLKQLVLIYAGIGGLTLFALLLGGPMGPEIFALLVLFAVVSEQVVNVIKNLWF